MEKSNKNLNKITQKPNSQSKDLVLFESNRKKTKKTTILQATDVNWMSVADQMRDLQNHLNSQNYTPGSYIPGTLPF